MDCIVKEELSRLPSAEFKTKIDNILTVRSAIASLNIDRDTEFALLKPKQYDCIVALIQDNTRDVVTILPTEVFDF